MRLSAILLGVTFLLIAFAAQSFAAVSFVHENTFTVPGVGPIASVRFPISINSPLPLVLVTDNQELVLYDFGNDSVTFSALADSGFGLDQVILADVNRDSLLDICAIRGTIQEPDNYLDPIRYWLDVYPSCVEPLRSSRLLDTSIGISFIYGLYRPSALAACDLDHDGYNELVVSLEDIGGGFSNGFIDEWTSGYMRIFHSAPDSLSSLQGSFATGFHRLDVGDGLTHFAVTTELSQYSELGPDSWYTLQDIYSLDDTGVGGALAASYKYGSGECYITDNASRNSFGCSGDINLASPGTELLSRFDWTFNCPGPVEKHASESRLELRRLLSPTQTSPIWSIDISGSNYTNFTYHPLLPGYFFAFAGDTLVMFRGSDGTIRDRITNVPTGAKHWDYLYSDSIPRLVVVNGASVSIYHLDIATDINDPNGPKELPKTFSLHDPYPNPFNPSATLSLETGPGGAMTLAVYNVRGQRVATLFAGLAEPNAHLSFIWNASMEASGVYFARLELAGQKQTKKMLLLK